MGKRIKEVEESELWIEKKIGKEFYKDGKPFVKVKWKQANEEVNLGSIANPDKKITRFQYRMKDSGLNALNNIFKSFRGE
jgi:hypothetical protein